MEKLSTVKRAVPYTIKSLEVLGDDIMRKMATAGLVPGAKITLLRKAPVFQDPLLFSINGLQLALTKEEASQIIVSEV